jgi:hypothetical protein
MLESASAFSHSSLNWLFELKAADKTLEKATNLTEIMNSNLGLVERNPSTALVSFEEVS